MSCLVACQQDAGPTNPGPLYQQWRQVKVFYSNSGNTVDVPVQDWAITKFRTNGTILYGANGRRTVCCSPNRFKRKGDILDFTDVASIPIPETNNSISCAAVDCIGAGDSWQILVLTPTQLVLKTGYGTATYQPYQ